MKIANTLKKYGFSESLIKRITSSGIADFYPPQKDAIHKGALKGKSLVSAGRRFFDLAGSWKDDVGANKFSSTNG